MDTRAYVPTDVYDRLVDLAKVRSQRLPVLMGDLLKLALDIHDGHLAGESLRNLATLNAETRPVKQDLEKVSALMNAILGTRFPKDTMGARLRQASLVHLIAESDRLGIIASGNGIAAYTDGDGNQVRALARLLVKRGVLLMKNIPHLGDAKWSKALIIRSDAVEALNHAHLKATGLSIPGVPADVIATYDEDAAD